MRYVRCSMVLIVVAWVLAFGCHSGDLPSSTKAERNVVSDLTAQSVPCLVSATRYPTMQSDMANVYSGRTFYVDGVHLGHDVQLSQGSPIAPVACGVLRFYGSATGYGQLVAVVEHALAHPLTTQNGKGEQVTVNQFLSIYGHLRRTPTQGSGNALPWKAGDTIGPNDVIGYVNDDAHNGDGAEHLHLGIRLQSSQAAQAVDPKAWFRGYDTTPSQRQWYADPVPFMVALMSNAKPVLWHPAGTVIHHPADGTYWMLDEDAARHPIDPGTVLTEKLNDRALDVSDAEFSCEAEASPFVSPRLGHQLVKFNDQSTVYEYSGLNPGDWRKAFLSYDVFLSWGWSDAQIQVWPASMRPWFFQKTQDQGYRMFRDGSLVKSDDSSEVSVVSSGVRLPIFNWETFVTLGYRPEWIVTVSASTMDFVAGPRGALITEELLGICHHPSACLSNCPPPSKGGGEGEGGSGTGGAGGSAPLGGSGGVMSGTDTNTDTSTVSSSTSTNTASPTAGTGGGDTNAPPDVSDAGSPSVVDAGQGFFDAGGVDAAASNPPDGGSSGTSTGVPVGKMLFRYNGPMLPGSHQLQAMWNPPGPTFYDWVPATFALCPDTIPGDGILECLLDMPSGTTGFLFTVRLPDGRWWSDWSCAPTGGCGAPIGTVTLTGPNGQVIYAYQSNQYGDVYKNGWVDLVP